MLKLIKHDFISTGRVAGVAYGIVALLSVFILITKKNDQGGVSAIGAALLVLAVMALFVVTSVLLMVDFHKSLYADRGYLTFTLPVKSWKILLSKLIVSGSWLVIALAAFFGTSMLFISAVDAQYGDEVDMLTELFEFTSGKNLALVIFSVFARVIILFIQFCCVALFAFLANTLSNVWKFQKHPVLYTIIFTVIAFVVLAKINEFANSTFAFGVFFVEGGPEFAFTKETYFSLYSPNTPFIDLGGVIVYIILGVGVFFLTHWLMSKKVNIK